MSDRHEKWTPVEAGTVIPAGQPYRVERWDTTYGARATEYVDDKPYAVRPRDYPVFVDSSWRPPLDLPTEPTWGIAVAQWARFGSGRAAFADNFVAFDKHLGGTDTSIPLEHVLDFIPLTDEQVARIEAAR